jgi:hypothetical protein
MVLEDDNRELNPWEKFLIEVDHLPLRVARKLSAIHKEWNEKPEHGKFNEFDIGNKDYGEKGRS